MDRMVTSTVVTGVGGQGVVSAADVVASVAFDAGLDVKKSDIHGMAQRGGTVVSFVRCGEKIYSPIVEQGTADFLIALEELEALRGIGFLKDRGVVILPNFRIPPPEVALGYRAYPGNIEGRLLEIRPGIECHEADVKGMLKQHPGYSINMFSLGIYARFLPYEKAVWLDAIRQRFKKHDTAIDSFLYGYARGTDDS
ncbi:MAG: 2-oxoacid:acceptor oxidoreductase family protein [Deltaproteobacteria bacterium]|nr:2-oxoacid:acceptor oxidoreductase family protein [Deltaproteobacteria bacterium]